MKPASSVIAEMRSATYLIHQELEKHLPVAAPDAGRIEYLDYLQDLWGWMLRFEAMLWNADWPTDVQAAARANKLSWIEDDLRAAGFTGDMIAAIPVAPFDPDLGSCAARFGLAYVIEGAQLGTRVLSKSLAPKLAPWQPRWLRGYGEENANLWRSFIASAERSLVTEESQRTAASSAQAAFASLASWFAARHNARNGRQLVQESGKENADELYGAQ